MIQITPQLVKELREKTGAGMSDCKNALIESEGNIQKAIEVLRRKGAASAAKRADRSAKEGIILAKTDAEGKHGIIVEINCETDFVAKNAEFEGYANKVATALLYNNINSTDELLKVPIDGDTIGGIHNEILAKFNENIQIRRFERLTTHGCLTSYVHAGNKLAVLVELSCNNLTENSKTMFRDIAMQIAAMNPQFIDRKDVGNEIVRRELEIYKQQAMDQGKNPEIAEKIASGKLEKFFQETCLIEQTFVKDPQKTIKDVLNLISKDSGCDSKVLSFRRYFLGEE